MMRAETYWGLRLARVVEILSFDRMLWEGAGWRVTDAEESFGASMSPRHAWQLATGRTLPLDSYFGRLLEAVGATEWGAC